MRELQAARGAALTRPRLLLLLVALVTIALDLASKLYVVATLEEEGRSVEVLGGLVTFVVSRNSGAAFSFATGATVVFTVIAVVVAAYILRSMKRLQSTGWAVCLGLLLGGALGNLIDRLFRAPSFAKGHVVDFISVPHFASFNIADSGITVGAVLAVLLSLRGVEIDGKRAKADLPGEGDEPAQH